MNKYIIVVDVGTQSLRAILYNYQGISLYSAQKGYNPTFNGIEVEQNPRQLKSALEETIKQVVAFANEKKHQINYITITSQRASIIPVNKHGKLLYNAITWQDRRAFSQCEHVKEKMSMQDIYKKTGLRLDSYFSAPKMLWLKQNMKEVYDLSYKIIGIQDYIVYLLTNQFVTDTTQAARTLLMNIHTFEWDDELIDAFGLTKDILPKIVPPGSIVGDVSNEMSTKLGLNSNTKVIIAGGDQQNAAVGLNVLRPNTLEANIGTGSFVIAYSEKPVFDENMRVLLSASAIPGKWIVEAGLLTSGNIYAWFKNEFYKEVDENELFDTINKEVNESSPGSNGLILIPHFKGSAAPYWNPVSRGVFFNVSLEHKRGDFARAILEGIAFEMAENIQLISDLIGYVDIIHVAGGLTKFSTFNQIQSDIFNKAVSVYDSSEATALGALIVSLVTLNMFKTHEEAFIALRGKAKKTTYHSDPKNLYKYSRSLRIKKFLYNSINDAQIYSYMLDK